MEPRGSIAAMVASGEVAAVIDATQLQSDSTKVAAVGQQTANNLRPKTVPTGAFPGDHVVVTVGEEKFFPVKFQGFTVGPVAFETVVGPGEDAGDAYARASAVAHAMFEAEFQMKRVDYWRRLGQVEPQ